jgi:hypothetical protein
MSVSPCTQAAEGLPIRLNERVTSVSVSADMDDSPASSSASSSDCLPVGAGGGGVCRVATQKGETVGSDYVVVALPLGQGLTLVHFSAQRKHVSWILNVCGWGQ